jgi:hypothetical protein
LASAFATTASSDAGMPARVLGAGASSWRWAYIVATSESRTNGGWPVRQWKSTQPRA